MTDAKVPCEGVCAAEGLFFGAYLAPHLDFPDVVNGVFVPRQIVGTREDCIAGLARRWVDPVALVRARLGVEEAVGRTGIGSPAGVVQPVRLAVTLPLVLLEQCGRLEPKGAAMVSAGVSSAVGRRAGRLRGDSNAGTMSQMTGTASVLSSTTSST